MSVFWCCECSATESWRWSPVADGKWLCSDCAQTVKDTFALAAALGLTGVELLMRVCEVES